MKTDLNSSLSSYFNENLEQPSFLYYGAAHEVNFEKIYQENKSNPGFEMYLTSHYNSAVANAFAQKIAEKNIDREYNMNINDEAIPILVADGVEDLDDGEKAFLYIFPCPDDAESLGHCNFKVTEPMLPVKVKDLIYRDHKMYYRIDPIDTKKK